MRKFNQLNSMILALVLGSILTSNLMSAPPTPPPMIKATVGEDYQVEITVAPKTVGSYRPGFRISDCLCVRLWSPDETKITLLVRPKRAGYYVLVLWTVGEATSSELVVDASGAAPPPVVDPPKPPPVDPVPIPTGPFKLVVIEETADATQRRGATFGDRTLVEWTRSKQSRIILADKDAVDEIGKTPPDLVPYLRRTTQYPYCVLEIGGKEVYAGPFTINTASELQQWLMKWTK